MRTSRLSPIWLVLVGILSVQFGAGIAKTLFDEVAPTTIVWLRLATSAVVLLAIARPALRGRTRQDWLVVLAFGLILGRDELGDLPVVRADPDRPRGHHRVRRPADAGGARLAAARATCSGWGWPALGVLLLGLRARRPDLGRGRLRAAGRRRLGGVHPAERADRPPLAGLDGLAVASVVATLLLTPLTLGRYADQLADARILVLGALVGLLSSVIPYTCELVALRTLRPAVFSILMSLEPAAAALAGLVVLQRGARARCSWWRWPAWSSPASAPPGPARRSPSRCRTDRAQALSSNCSRSLHTGVMRAAATVASVESTPSSPGPESHHDLAQPPVRRTVRRARPGPRLARRVPAGRPPQRHVASTALAAAPRRAPGRRRLLRRAAPPSRTAAAAPAPSVHRWPTRAARHPAGSDRPSAPAESAHADLCGARRDRRRASPTTTSSPTTAPAYRLDQRPRRDASTARPSCSATGSAPAPWAWPALLAPTAASGSSRGTTAAPAAPTARPTRATAASRRSSRTRLSVMDHFGIDRAPCSWAGRWASTRCSSWPSATPSG